MRLKTGIKWGHRILTLVLLIIVVGFGYLDHAGDDRKNDKLISSQQLDDRTWLYVTENGSGGATVPFIYRYYLGGKIEGRVSETLIKAIPFMEAGGSAANISKDNDTININYGGRVFSFSNSVTYEYQGETITPHINFHASN